MTCRDAGLSPWPRVAIGLGVLGIGLIELLDNLGLIEDRQVYPWFWPVALGTVSLAFLVGRRGHPSQAWGWMFGVFAVLAAIHSLRFDLPFEPWNLFWPVVLLAAGFAVVRQALSGPRPVDGDDGSTVSSFALMAGIERTNRSSAFRGGHLSAIMGGVELDLSSAELAPGGAVLEIFAMWGGIEIKVPEGWQIDLRVFPLMGGVEDRSRPDGRPDGPRLTIRGVVVMAGGEVHC
jgi:hypothetical protein